MIKLLLLIVIVVLAYLVVKGYKRKMKARTAAPVAGAEDMVRCAHCGVHLPRSESLMSGQAFYCSVEHRPDHQKVS